MKQIIKGFEKKICSYCGNRGHWRPDCMELKKDLSESMKRMIRERNKIRMEY
jgi:hypothetical protein